MSTVLTATGAPVAVAASAYDPWTAAVIIGVFIFFLVTFAAMFFRVISTMVWAVIARPDTAAPVEDEVSTARRHQVEQIAAAHGWRFDPRDPGLGERWAPYLKRSGVHTVHPLEKVPFNRRFENVVSGTHRGHPFVGFDLMVAHGPLMLPASTPSRTVAPVHDDDGPGYTCHSVLALYTGVLLPRIQVTPNTYLSRAMSAAMGHYVKFESDAFNQRFAVSTTQPKAAFDLLSARLLGHLLDGPDIAWETIGADLLLVADNDPFDADQLRLRLDFLADIAEQYPPMLAKVYPAWHAPTAP